MKVRCKVTKVMAKTLQKEFKNYRIQYEEMGLDDFKRFVRVDYLDYLDDDYNWDKERFKVIRVSYPSTYYAMDRFLTTSDLKECIRRTPNKTLEQFLNEIRNEIEI